MTEPAEKRSRAWPLIKRFWPFARPHLRYVWVMLAFLLLSAPLSVVSPLIIRRVIDDAISEENRESLYYWGRILIGMTFLSVVFGITIGFCTTMFHTKVLRDLRDRIYRHMQRLSLRYYSRKETGHMMSRQLDDVGQLGGVMADAFGRVTIDAVKAVVYIGMLFYVEWRMATGGLVLALLIFGFEYAISGRMRRLNKEARERWTDVSEALHQGLSGHYLVQSTASEKRETRRFLRTLHASVRAGFRRDMFELWTNHVFHLIAGVAPPLIILAGVYLIVTSDFTFGGLFAFFMYLVQMFAAVGAVAGFNPAMQRSLASVERIFEVLGTDPEVESPPDAVKPEGWRGEVVFEGVGFAYDEGRGVLHDVDLTVPPHTMVALVGPSGAGKTTLAHLLPRFYDPTAGRITVDGHDLRTLDLRHYRRHVGIVPQEIFLFDRTVEENIAYGAPGATPESIRRAAEAAHAAEFIAEMEKGYETVIGERGVRLSGGQRQRLAIAREILRNPTILILDEATSSLDSESERLIQEALEALLAGRTSFVIAHRLSTVVKADVILAMEDGRIVEQGTHAELLERGGLYARLYRSQFEGH